MDNIRSRLVALDEVWTSFFNSAQSASEDAIAQGWVTRDDFAAYEASLFVGVPSLVAMDALVRSKDARGIILMDGVTEITEENRPRAFIADRVFTPMLELRSALALLDLSEDELAAAKRHAATCGAQAYSQSDSQGAGVERAQQSTEEGVPPGFNRTGRPTADDDDRRTQIMRVLGGVQSIAIDVSRTPTFRRRFNEVMGAVSSGEVNA